MNNFNYNVTGEKRKELVRAMSEILGEDASYQGAPSFAFKIDGYTVSRDGLDGEADAYTRLVSALCNMAKNQKRVTAKERDSENEKFTMRLFLIRLGFIGDEYKTARKTLLRNLTDNGSWKSGHAPERTANAAAEAAPAAESEGGAPYDK